MEGGKEGGKEGGTYLAVPEVDVVGVEVVMHERALLPEELHTLVIAVSGLAADVDGDVTAVLEGELDEGCVDGLARLGGEGGR